MSALTPKQQQIYDFILSFSGRHGYPPSVREIGEHVGRPFPGRDRCPLWAMWPPAPPSWPRSASRTT